MILTVLGLSLIYLWLLQVATNGYGYSNSGGYGSRASGWYWSDVETYHERSNRAGSPGGSNLLGGGPESGK
jgi:hypothetical protein